MRSAIPSILLLLSSLAWAAEPVMLENGKSPDGKYFTRIQPPVEPGTVISMEVCKVKDGAVVGRTAAGGYAPFPLVADEVNTAVLWSPDSKHLALMTRGTKRTWELSLFQITDTGMAEIILPDATERALQVVKSTATNRSLHQRPLRWADNCTLTVRASGDAVNPDGSSIPLWYEVDVTYDIVQKKVSASKLIEVKPNEG
ncbi:MAG: hypothetical protein J0L73_14350 [Verrucomicrobia bacterium]|nr:hypothetical protein [Verrucomicrobiota bacterium]